MRVCERCGAEPEGSAYALHDHCRFCSKNLCPRCMAAGTCVESPARKHEAPEYDEDGNELD